MAKYAQAVCISDMGEFVVFNRGEPESCMVNIVEDLPDNDQYKTIIFKSSVYLDKGERDADELPAKKS